MRIGYRFTRRDGATCESGLRVSPTPWSALPYATGSVLWEVEVPDDRDSVARSSARSRTADLTDVLRWFANEEALEGPVAESSNAMLRRLLSDGFELGACCQAAARAGAGVVAARLAAAAAGDAPADQPADDASATPPPRLSSRQRAMRRAAWDRAWAAVGTRFNSVALRALTHYCGDRDQQAARTDERLQRAQCEDA